MKKLASLLIAASMLLVLILPLSSCSEAARLSRMDEAERASRFYALVDSNMNNAESFVYDQTMVLDVTIDGSAYKQTTDVSVAYSFGSETMTHVEKSVTTVDSVGKGTVIYMDTGYIDGMMFSYAKEGNNVTKLKSSLSPTEYSSFLQYRNDKAPLIDMSADHAKTVTCKQNEDDTWIATYEGFTAEGMTPFLYMLRGVDFYLTDEHDLVDVRMTITANRDFYPTTSKIEFIFEENPEAQSGVPVVSLESVYHGWNETDLTNAYDVSDFTKVRDLRAVDVFLDALLDRSYAEQGTVNVTTSTLTTKGNVSVTSGERQKMTYSNRDGFAFELFTEEDDYEYEMTYADGNLHVHKYDDGGNLINTTDEPMSYAEARATATQIIDAHGLSSRSFSDVKITDAETGICRFTLSDAFANAYKEAYEMSGATLSNFTGRCEAVLGDGVLTKYSYHMEMTLQARGGTYRVTVDIIVIFGALEQDTETV